VVKLWWIDGELWCFDGQFSGVKNFPLLEVYFWWGELLAAGGRGRSAI
jgi:hypothetical protein